MATRPRRTPPPLPAPTPAPVNPTSLYPITEWPHPWPPIGGMRWIIFNAAANGFASAFVRVGRRILVDEAEFFRCVEKGRASKPHPIARRPPQSRPAPVAILDSDEVA